MKIPTIATLIFLAGCSTDKPGESRFELKNPNGGIEVFVNQLQHTELPTWVDEPIYFDPMVRTSLPPPNCRLPEREKIILDIEKTTPTSQGEIFTSYLKIGGRIIFLSNNTAQENGTTFLLGFNLENNLSAKCGFSKSQPDLL